MLTFFGANATRSGRHPSRRDFLQIGALGLGGLTLAELLQLRAQGAVQAGSQAKAVIMVYLFGGPSHIDTYDLKPDAPVEYRGEFRPIQTNVPGFDICELMPMQARIADKLALIRNLKFNPNFHDPVELLSGFRKPTESGSAARPDFGSVVSRLRQNERQHRRRTWLSMNMWGTNIVMAPPTWDCRTRPLCFAVTSRISRCTARSASSDCKNALRSFNSSTG